MSHDQPTTLEEVLDGLLEATRDEETAAVYDILEAFGSRAFGPLLIAPSLIALSPVGMIPGAPAVLAVLIVLVSVQRAIGLSSPWLPRVVRLRAVPRDRFADGVEKVRPWAKRLDRLLKPRLTFLVKPPIDRVIAVMVSCMAVTMVPLEFIPFAVAAPAAGMLCLGIGVSMRDGFAALLGYVGFAGTCFLGWVWWSQS